MAGKKKTKKPAANPARGFATTSVASKPRVDALDSVEEAAGSSNNVTGPSAADPAAPAASQGLTGAAAGTESTKEAEKSLSP
jgi:ATP-dependent RNA helicase DHX29